MIAPVRVEAAAFDHDRTSARLAAVDLESQTPQQSQNEDVVGNTLCWDCWGEEEGGRGLAVTMRLAALACVCDRNLSETSLEIALRCGRDSRAVVAANFD